MIGVDLPDTLSNSGLRPVDGVETAGESALRNSV